MKKDKFLKKLDKISKVGKSSKKQAKKTNEFLNDLVLKLNIDNESKVIAKRNEPDIYYGEEDGFKPGPLRISKEDPDYAVIGKTIVNTYGNGRILVSGENNPNVILVDIAAKQMVFTDRKELEGYNVAQLNSTVVNNNLLPQPVKPVIEAEIVKTTEMEEPEVLLQKLKRSKAKTKPASENAEVQDVVDKLQSK